MRFSTPKYDIQLVMGSEVKDKELPRVLQLGLKKTT